MKILPYPDCRDLCHPYLHGAAESTLPKPLIEKNARPCSELEEHARECHDGSLSYRR